MSVINFSPFYGYPPEILREWLGVSATRARRLKAGTSRPTPPELKLFRLYRDKQVLDGQWKNWGVTPDKIFDPDGNGTTQAQLRGYWLIIQFARELARDAGPATLDAYQRLLA